MRKRILRSLLRLSLGLIHFVGLPLAGWGFDELPRFFQNPARTLYAVLLVALQVFSVIYLPRTRQKSEGLDNKIDLISIRILSLAVVFIAPYTDRRSIGTLVTGNWIRVSGLWLASFGFILMRVAEKHLYRPFLADEALQDHRRLVTTGPYRHIRHPGYLGIILFFAGIALVFQSFPALVIVAALILVLAWRAFAEEERMRKVSVQEWDEYRAKSRRIIPFLY